MIKRSLIILSLLVTGLAHAEEPATEVDTGNNIKAGEEIFYGYCADACHQAPDRSRLRPKQWRVVLNTMKTRMQSAGKVPLTEQQNKLLLDYLSQEN